MEMLPEVISSENRMNASLRDARARWRAGEALEAGRLLIETMPDENIVNWSLKILHLGVTWIPAPTAVTRLAEQKRQLGLFRVTPRQHFETIRRLTLKYEASKIRTKTESSILSLCYLAENVAKVLCNSSKTDDELEFDEDSGWWIVRCLYDCAQSVGSNEFFDECEQLLFGGNQSGQAGHATLLGPQRDAPEPSGSD